MFYYSRRVAVAAAALCAFGVATGANAASVTISITNEQPGDGLYLTPLLTVLHGGTFDPFDVGEEASLALEELAEEGDPSLLIAEARENEANVIVSPGGFPGAPVIDPGETASISVHADPFSNRFLSFFSMVIPSNDSFIGNDNPMAYEVFDALGHFTGGLEISVFASDIWDAGTEVNAVAGNGEGAAFAVNGGPRGSGADEGGVVTRETDLSFLLNTAIPTGGFIGSVPAGQDLLATISVGLTPVPLPAGMPLLLAGLGGLAMLRRRKHA